VKPGDLINLPGEVPHGFETQGDENRVLLVVATAGWKPLEDTEILRIIGQVRERWISVAIIICMWCLRPLLRARGESPVAIPRARPANLLWESSSHDLSSPWVTVWRSERLRVFRRPHDEEFGWSRSTISLAAASDSW